jgi:outer membrane lipoprotein SlyB
VVYHERVIYREPEYSRPAPQYERPVNISINTQDEFTGQVLGGITGAIVGSNLGAGNGRVASTAVGAVVGTIAGGNLARR